MENCIKLRINAGDRNAGNAQVKAIADAYGNKFTIPLDFEMIDAAHYYQAGLGNRLCYKITFNDYNRVTKYAESSSKVPDAKYKITDTLRNQQMHSHEPGFSELKNVYTHCTSILLLLEYLGDTYTSAIWDW